MNQEYFMHIMQGIPVSLFLTITSLFCGFILAVVLTFLLAMNNPIVRSAVNLFIVFFTGTPMLVQILLIYSGPGQFEWIIASPAWVLLSKAWFCAILALTLNSAAYTTQLFYGALKAIPAVQWEACYSLGLTKYQTLKILIPYALRRALPSYGNEIIIILKSSALASTITIMDIMGYTRQLIGQTYDALGGYGAAGLIYLVIAVIFYFITRKVERHILAFERRD